MFMLLLFMTTIFMCLFGMSSIIAWSLAEYHRRRNAKLQRAYEDALQQWQDCLIETRGVYEQNVRLTQALEDQLDESDWWKK